LILDEIFGSLDDVHRATVVDLMRHLGDRFEQVILITHIESVREMLDHVVSLRFDDGSGACSSRGCVAGHVRECGSTRLMAIARNWRANQVPEGPLQARFADIPALNRIFSDSFTERYRRDGLTGVRVPHLNPAIWQYAMSDANGGALLWRDDRGEIAAFNVVHRSGREGWMGPLAVRPDLQGTGVGKRVVRAGITWLQEAKAGTIGLETMPRTMDNIGFYSSLGLVPGRLTITVTVDAAHGERPHSLLSRLTPDERDHAVVECRELLNGLLDGYDFTRELLLTHELGLGDTVIFRAAGSVVGYALCHTVPLVEG